MWRHAAHLRFYIFHKAIIFRNAPLCPQTVGALLSLPPPPPFTSNKSDLAGEQGRDKGRWIEAAPSGLPAVSWKVLNNTALLVTEPTGKHELDGEQTEVLNLLPAATPHTCSTATVVLLQHPRLIRTASKKNMVIWTAHAHCSALHIRKLWIHDTVTSVSVH